MDGRYLTSLDLGDKFNTTKVTNMDQMFYSCGASMTLDISAMSFTSNLTSYYQIFVQCGEVTTKVYVKDSAAKTWVTNNKNANWSNSNIIIGSI